jgi:hypothetical protein
MARKQYKEAAKTAIIIANEEQINGIIYGYLKNIMACIMYNGMYNPSFQEIIETLMTFYLGCIKN